MGTDSEKVMEMEKEPAIESISCPTREKEPTPNVEKRTPPLLKEYVPRLPYPSRLKNNRTNEQFKRFMDLLKQLHINVPFVEALSQMPKFRLSDLKPTRMTLQLADRSIRHPTRIIEDVLVKVDKFIFLVDFVILDLDEDVEVPLILGRSFLATSQALIDVGNGRMTLRVGDEEVIFALSDEILQNEALEELLDDPHIEEATLCLHQP
ncbi:uncharacterized protein LOC120272975 [Dioscorea cayenensis subsp. rotundata]|uniref:Uncharacterized protein LOC120272975 n=1 Tax=Dioscorea cayennensis subsp. rotundata TaxID=55577 RepID=A0AB40C9R8_DIOCR|nr:uncharacterized protein LOC120272975 [Dioscorea cayenensis subsp. rotundata]